MMAKRRGLTRERLLEALSYSPKTGVFKWRISPNRRIRVGNIAGSSNSAGYLLIMIDNDRYRAHRLAWLYVHDEWSLDDIDHINGDPSDNRLSNLRLATRSQNMANARKPITNTSGFKGVYYDRSRGKWAANIWKDKKNFYLGRYSTLQEAHAAYVNASKKHFGEFARLK